MHTRIPSRIARSCMVPIFFTSAGARFTVIRRAGRAMDKLDRAERIRSRLSRTEVSGRPTISICGLPRFMLTSTSTEKAFSPNSPKLFSWVNKRVHLVFSNAVPSLRRNSSSGSTVQNRHAELVRCCLYQYSMIHKKCKDNLQERFWATPHKACA